MNKCKRVCYVISGDLWGGAEAQAYQLAISMIDSGFQVFVITFNKGVLFDKFCEMPIVVQCLDESKKSLFETIFNIRSFLKDNEIDLVHCHGFKENLLAGVASKVLLSCKVIRTHHGRGVVKGSFVKSFIEKINAHLLTDKMISVSHDLKAYLTSLAYPEHKIDVVHNGVDCGSLTVSKGSDEIMSELSIPEKTFVIGTASRIVNEKGYEYLLLALKELLNSGHSVVLVIIGSGPLQLKYHEMSVELGVSKSVIFAGFQKDVCSYLNYFDLFVMMSLNEGIPLALIEAMCMSKPVVCSAVGGIPEIVISGENGVLVPSMDYLACAAACSEIISHETIQKSLGVNAHKHVVKNFSARESVENTIKLYQGVLAS